MPEHTRDGRGAHEPMELTILMPCLNEAETVATCIAKARDYLRRSAIDGEVLIADNGSTDGSQALAVNSGARVVAVSEKGYGSALIGGIRAANGRYVIMGDADDSYDFAHLDPFVARLRLGDKLVMGDRFAGGIVPGAMPPLHRYLGNPVLSFIGRLLFPSKIRDFHCGLRAFDRAAMLRLDLSSSGMEFASEMAVKATLAELPISNVPTVLSPDGRSRPPHLRSWRDGWRHLRFLLLMSPRWLLLYPGLTLTALGVAAQLATLGGPVVVKGVGFDIHTMLYASGTTILGLQLILFSVVTHAIGCVKRLLPMTASFRRFLRLFSLERGLVLGGSIWLLGIAIALYSIRVWIAASLSAVDPAVMMRIAIPSVTLMLAGAEIALASFVLSFIDVRPDDPAKNGG